MIVILTDVDLKPSTPEPENKDIFGPISSPNCFCYDVFQDDTLGCYRYSGTVWCLIHQLLCVTKNQVA